MFSSGFSRILVSAVVTVVLAVGHLPGSARAATPDAPVVPAASSASPTPMTPAQIIAKEKKRDAKSFKKRYAKLKKSKALVDLVKATVPSRKRATYLKLLTALSTSKQVSKLVSKTKGKHFKVTMTADGSVSVKLLKGKGKAKVLNSGPECWEAWVAWYAWFAGTSALCWGAGALNPGLGIICALALGVISFTLVDFNNACKSASPMAVPVGARRFGNE
jgi:hypothetical protein